MPDGTTGHEGIGASVLRKEDKRFLNGEGRYVADIARPRMLEAAIVRSPVAHASNLKIVKPDGAEKRFFTAEDMAADGVQPIHVVSKFPGHRASDYPHLATDKARFVGEAVAVCLAETRAGAEDLAAQTGLSFDPLPAVVDMLEAVDKPPALVHDDWDDNVILDPGSKRTWTALQTPPCRSPVPSVWIGRPSIRWKEQRFSPNGIPETNVWLSTARRRFRISSRTHYANAWSCGKTRCM